MRIHRARRLHASKLPSETTARLLVWLNLGRGRNFSLGRGQRPHASTLFWVLHNLKWSAAIFRVLIGVVEMWMLPVPNGIGVLFKLDVERMKIARDERLLLLMLLMLMMCIEQAKCQLAPVKHFTMIRNRWEKWVAGRTGVRGTTTRE